MKKIMSGFLLAASLLLSVAIPNARAGELEDLKWRVEQLEQTQEEGKYFSIRYDKGLVLNTFDKKYLLKINVWLQPQYQFLAVEGRGDTNNFMVRRARLDLKGNLFHPNLKFRMQNEFAGQAGNPTANLLDGYLDWQWFPYFQIKGGQYKVPFSRESLASAAELQFVDKSIVDATLGLARDLGVDFHGTLLEKLNYDFFIMNGDGRNLANRNNEMLVGSRFTYNFFGDHGYKMSDPWDTADPQLALALALLFDTGNAALGEQNLFRLTGDVVYRHEGLSLYGEAHYVSNTTANQSDYGFLAQAGYFILPERFEVALRWGGVITAPAGALATGPVDPYEATLGLNYFFAGHPVKLQGDYAILWNAGATQNRNDHRFRLQGTVFF